MNLENVNKKALIIILALIILLFINIPYLLFIVLFLAFLSPFLVGMLRFLKSDKVTKKETLKKYFFNIYWKKNLLFLFIFIITDIFSVILGNLSFNVRGFPIPYYSHYFQDPLPSFYPTFLILNILFWYLIAGLIIKRPIEMSKNVVKLDYITLIVAFFVILYSFWGLTSNYLIDNLGSDKNKIKECENLSDEQENDRQYSQRFNCYVDYAIKNDNIKLCRLAKHKKEYNLYGGWGYMSGGEEVCYEEVALRTLNYELCDNIDNLENIVCTNAIIKAQCYSGVAIVKKDPSICDRIEGLGKDCEGTAFKEIKEKCYLEVRNK